MSVQRKFGPHGRVEDDKYNLIEIIIYSYQWKHFTIFVVGK